MNLECDFKMKEAWEDRIAQQANTYTNEKTFIDKLTAKEDVSQMRKLHIKEKNERKDILEMLQLLVGNETKLLNFDEKERHILGKYFIKIRQAFQITDEVWDYFEQLEKLCNHKQTLLLWKDNMAMVNGSSLFCVDTFQWLSRSGMSIEGAGFKNILTNRFELAYPKGIGPEEKKGLLAGAFGK